MVLMITNRVLHCVTQLSWQAEGKTERCDKWLLTLGNQDISGIDFGLP
jgi:hypothetical protein